MIMRALMSTRRAIVGGALAVSLVASTAPAYAQTTYGVTEAPTPAGIRLAHMQIAGEKDHALGTSLLDERDPRAAFVLMHVDGLASVEMILDVCAMPEPEALRLLVQMKELGVLRFD